MEEEEELRSRDKTGVKRARTGEVDQTLCGGNGGSFIYRDHVL